MTESKPTCNEIVDLTAARVRLAQSLGQALSPEAEQALDLAHRCLRNQRTSTGSNLFAHALGTALIVAELRLGSEPVIAALLHPLAETAPDTLLEFGPAGDLARAVAAMARIEVLARGSQDPDVEAAAHVES